MLTHATRRLFVTLAALAVLTAGGPAADEPKAQGPALEEGDAWVYRSKEHGFTLKLPSRRWKEVGKGKSVVAFANLFPFQMTVAVMSVNQESLEQYQARVQGVKDYLKTNEATLLEKPEVIEQTTEAGTRRWCVVAKEKGKEGMEYLLVGISYTWVKERGITVETLFEGVGKAKSKLFQSHEKDAFGKSVKAVCLSVE